MIDEQPYIDDLFKILNRILLVKENYVFWKTKDLAGGKNI